MIKIINKPFKDEESLGVLNSYVRKWFTSNFSELTPPQKFSFKLISERENILITAPTGSGKTMSAFVSILNELFNKSLNGKLDNKIYCLYISPLKALNNDILRNLEKPLEGIYNMIREDKGIDIVKGNIKSVSIGVRTGDTEAKERRKQLTNPPNILVTTPESLAILLNSTSFIKNLDSLEYVVIDEIHELANNKRGVHLSLSLERLDNIIGKHVNRVGLSATLYPLEEAAKFLVGYENGKPRSCYIVDASWSKKLSVKSISPVKDMLYSTGEQIESAIYKDINEIIKKSKTTLIFTNTRSGTERVVFNLKKRFNYTDEEVGAHHSSLSRGSRFKIEEDLKKGNLKCAVSSTSLELGVDIGDIDNVVQLGSPKSVTRAIQRIGRSGHSFREIAKGEIIVVNRDDLVECSIMLDAALKRHLDSFSIPMNALDVLAQHIVGMAITKEWDVDEAYNLIKQAYPYNSLEKNDFMSLLNYLAGNYVGLESRHIYGKIWYDEEKQKFGKRGMFIRVIYMLNLGTIPDSVSISVYNKDTNSIIGSLEEGFLVRLKPGDIFTLGGKLYKFEYSKGMSCYVSDASSKTPTIPPWFSETLPLSYELAVEIGEFRRNFSKLIKPYLKYSKPKLKKIVSGDLLPKEVNTYLSKLPINEYAKYAIMGYFTEQELFAGVVPNDKLMLIEFTNDEVKDENYLIFHSLYGRRINDTLSRLIAMVLGKMLNEDIGTMVNDNGFVLLIGGHKITQQLIKKLIDNIIEEDAYQLLSANINNTELMKRKFRQIASRSFMILRNYKGNKISVLRQQISSNLILKAVEEIDPNFPIIKETYREILNDVMDLPRTEYLLKQIKQKKLKYKFINTPSPSPFAHSMLTYGHTDIVMMKDRKDYLIQLHKLVMHRLIERKII